MSVATARQPGLAFLSFDSFAAPEREAPPEPARTYAPSRSPFLALYESEDGAGEPSAQREAFASLVDQLHDDEFEAAMAAVQGRGRAFHDGQLAAGVPRAQADRLLVQHFEPLLRQSAGAIDALSERYAAQEGAGIVEHELEAFVDGYTPTEALAPEFENFFGKLLKKVGKVAKAAVGKAWQGIKSVALAPLLRALKSHVMGFLKGAVQRVIGRIPAPLQPAAQQLARKLGFNVKAPQPAPVVAPTAPAEPTPDTPPTIDPAQAADAAAPVADSGGSQEELDAQLAGTLLASDEVALEAELAAAAAAAPAAVPVYAELDDARERFIHELEALREGESPEPAMQNFLPALMPVLSMASKAIGHDRLAGFVAGALSPLVGRLIGPAQAPALAKALASAGLKLLNMETSEEIEPERLAAPAVAATVEETMARVAALPPEVHADRELLEAFTLEAFEAAAAANLPAVLSEATYEQRPELLEAGIDAAWPMLPATGGPRRYKRCTQVFTVPLSPHLAAELESFEGAPLADFVQDQLGLPDHEELQAEVVLYEALPGTTLADIARGERETLGPGLADEALVEQLHPLTPQAAAALLHRPGLGRAWWARSRHRALGGGQRFYALLPTGARRPQQRRRPLHLRLVLDMVKDEVRACVFISEVKAQKIAVQLRQPAGAGALASRFQRWLQRRLWHLFFGQARHRLRIVHAALPPGQPAAARTQRLPQATAQPFARALQTWLVQGFAEAVRTQGAAIQAATENPAEGITLGFTIAQPPGLQGLADALTGKAAGAAAPAGAAPVVKVSVAPGHACA